MTRGTVLLVALDPAHGHEQAGLRPCILVSDPQVSLSQRFPLVAVVPITTTPAQGLLYPALAPGSSGLAKPSWALVDHVRSIDKRRVLKMYGELARTELEAIDEAVSAFLGLG